MAFTLKSKKNLFFLVEALFQMKRQTPCCPVRKRAPGELLVKVLILYQVKERARFSVRNKQIIQETF